MVVTKHVPHCSQFLTPLWKWTQDNFLIPVKIPAEYENTMTKDHEIQKRKKSTGGPSLRIFIFYYLLVSGGAVAQLQLCS